jgi:hypothetical protein
MAGKEKRERPFSSLFDRAVSIVFLAVLGVCLLLRGLVTVPRTLRTKSKRKTRNIRAKTEVEDGDWRRGRSEKRKNNSGTPPFFFNLPPTPRFSSLSRPAPSFSSTPSLTALFFFSCARNNLKNLSGPRRRDHQSDLLGDARLPEGETRPDPEGGRGAARASRAGVVRVLGAEEQVEVCDRLAGEVEKEKRERERERGRERFPLLHVSFFFYPHSLSFSFLSSTTTTTTTTNDNNRPP